MALPTATVTGILYKPDGTPFASALVQIRATPRTIVGATGGGGRVPELVIAHTDATGAIGTMAGDVFTAGVELSAGQYYIVVGDTYIKAPATVTADMVTAGAATVQNILATAEPIPPAQSVPAGGTTGQVLTKASADDYATEWATVDGVGGGGSGTVTSVDTGTGLTGGPITGAGTVALDAASIASLGKADTAFSWGNHATAGYSTFSGAYADLTGKPALFDGSYASLSGVPATFTPAAHTHTAANVTNFATAADARIDASDKVSSNPTGITGADAITNIVSLTQAEYDAIGTPDATTLYVIT